MTSLDRKWSKKKTFSIQNRHFWCDFQAKSIIRETLVAVERAIVQEECVQHYVAHQVVDTFSSIISIGPEMAIFESETSSA